MELRPYQQEAVDAVYRYLRDYNDNPCVVIPTAGGKTPILATIVKDALQLWHGRVMIVSHVKELLAQAVDKIRTIYPDCDLGVYSAGLGSRETSHACIVAGIQSVYKHAEEIGPVNLVIVDEAHTIPLEGTGTYRTFLAAMKKINPQLRVIGLTATPYRLDGGPICGPDNILNNICYEAGIRELLGQGYLCPLKSKASKHAADTSSIHIRNGEFASEEVNAVMNDSTLVRNACREIVDLTKDRHSVLIFCSSVAHAKHVAEGITQFSGQECPVITGETPSAERAENIERFKGNEVATDLYGTKKPPVKYLSNCSVLSTGFDAPNIDCVVLLRPTVSPGLYYQMVGRGFRLHPHKKDTLILDFAGNIVRHGPVDCIRSDAGSRHGETNGKVCPGCDEVVAKNVMICPVCEYAWIKQEAKPRELKHDVKPSNASIISGDVTLEDYAVSSVHYSVHAKRDADETAPKSMRVEYVVDLLTRISEWVCPEHTGYARQRFVKWWMERAPAGCPIPDTAEEAVALAEANYLTPVTAIKTRYVTGDRFERITGYTFGPKAWEVPPEDWREQFVPSCRQPCETAVSEEDLPF